MSYTNEEMANQIEAIDLLIDDKDRIIAELKEACKEALNRLYDNMEDMEQKHGKIEETIRIGKMLQQIIDKAEEM